MVQHADLAFFSPIRTSFGTSVCHAKVNVARDCKPKRKDPYLEGIGISYQQHLDPRSDDLKIDKKIRYTNDRIKPVYVDNQDFCVLCVARSAQNNETCVHCKVLE